MPDLRFFETLPPISLAELAALVGADTISGAPAAKTVARVASLARADADAVGFVSGHRGLANLAATRAGACFVAPSDAERLPHDCVALITPMPQAAFAIAADRLHQPRRHLASSGHIDQSAQLEEGVALGPGVTIGPNAHVGRNTFIAAGAVIGPGVSIGRDSFIGARACVGFALIGDRVRIHAGAVIGEPGFGAAPGPHGIVDIPQLGRVIVQDAVTVGSGSCIDRGALEDTVIGENTKIDNLVQIGHNVVIGRNCLLAAHTGISGSVTIGDGCQFGGRAGIADHINIGSGARIGAAAGVMSNVPAGESWGGFPARPVKRWLRETAILSRLANRKPLGEQRT